MWHSCVCYTASLLTRHLDSQYLSKKKVGVTKMGDGREKKKER